MNLGKKKILAAKTLGVGKDRVAFIEARKEDIKEAITKQDIKDLHKDGAIFVKDVKGRKKNIQRKRKRNTGKIKKKVKKRKREYVAMTRKLRKYILGLRKEGKLKMDEIKEIRKKIRNRLFKSKANLKDYIGGLKK